ncbi:MAG: diheme cytochrome c [Nitrospira sp.]|nr:diheme cytochrome c [Nitrospira sp.]
MSTLVVIPVIFQRESDFKPSKRRERGMRVRNFVIPLLTAGILLAGTISGSKVFAEERGERMMKYSVPESPIYKQECSSCHFLYLPGLLPARSWKDLIKNSDKHFGENLALGDKDRGEILSYLMRFSAERTNTEWSKRILKNIGSGTPARITEVPYIKLRHRNIRPELFKRPSVGSFSNCSACHPGAANGDFEEDRVKIPKL